MSFSTEDGKNLNDTFELVNKQEQLNKQKQLQAEIEVEIKKAKKVIRINKPLKTKMDTIFATQMAKIARNTTRKQIIERKIRDLEAEIVNLEGVRFRFML